MPRKVAAKKQTMAIAVDNDELTQFDEKALRILDIAKQIMVEDDDQMQKVAEFLKGCKAALKDLDKTFDESIATAQTALETVRNAKKRHSEPIKEAEAIVKKRLGDYNVQRHLLADQRNKEAMQQAATGNMTALPELKADNAPKLDGVSFREKWTAEAIDLKAVVMAISEGKAPLDLVQANKSGCNAFAEATKGQIPVPGLKFSKDTVVSSRAA